MDDWQLLHDYATRNSEEAFRVLVDRYAGLVYHAALRQAGNPHTAEEVTQAMFIALAQKADRIPRGAILSGWLFLATRFAFSNLAREQIRRQRREQEAVMMEDILRPDDTASVWEQIVPHLNDALDKLPRKDREAVLVRFFQDKSHRELARALGVSEDAAKVHVSRALEKLRLIFARQGFVVPSAVLLATISAYGAQAAPTGLTASVASVAVAKGAAGTTSTLTIAKGVLKIMAWTKAKIAIVSGVVVLLAAGTATITVKEVQEHKTDTWQDLPAASNPRLLDQLPPQVRIVPSKHSEFNVCGKEGKILMIGAPVKDILATAYGVGPTRAVFPMGQASEKYDLFANLPHGNKEALQKEVKRKFGLVGKTEVRETDVLLLKVKDSAKLQSHTDKGQIHVYPSGGLSIGHAPLLDLASALESFFEKPVVDQTGMSGNYQFLFLANETNRRSMEARSESVQQTLLNELDQAGLELVPTNMPIDMLVVEKAK